MGLRCLASLALAACVLAPGSAGADRWVSEGEGVCRREWTAGSMLRGPAAVGNGVLMPFRSLAGSVTGGWVAAALLPFGAMVGLAEGIAWTVVGTVEMLTGGAFALAPEGASDGLHLAPVVQFPFSRRSLDEYRADGCPPS